MTILILFWLYHGAPAMTTQILPNKAYCEAAGKAFQKTQEHQIVVLGAECRTGESCTVTETSTDDQRWFLCVAQEQPKPSERK